MNISIAVLGADPIGVVLAILLSKKGFSVEIFDRKAEHLSGFYKDGVKA